MPLHPDDLTNLFLAWYPPWSNLLRDVVTPWSEVIRPVGALAYRGLYEAFGLSAAPIHVLQLALLAANTGLVFLLCCKQRFLAWSGVAAMSMAAFHPRLLDLYTNGGTIYDALCGFLTLLALLLVSGRSPGLPTAAAITLFSVLAFNAKEVALPLPAFLFLSSVVGEKRFPGWKLTGCLALNQSLLIAGVLARKARMGANPNYDPQLTSERLWSNLTTNVRDLLAVVDPVPEAGTLLLWSLPLLLGLALRNRNMILWGFGWVLFQLPLLTIVPRGFYAIYVPYLMLCCWLGAAIDAGLQKLNQAAESRRIFAVTAVVAVCVLVQAHFRKDPWSQLEQRDGSCYLIEQMKRDLGKTLADNSPERVLFLHDPFTTEDWMPFFIVKLLLQKRDMTVDRVKMMGRTPDLASYDLVLDYRVEQSKPTLLEVQALNRTSQSPRR
jgi:hypothetical protein